MTAQQSQPINCNKCQELGRNILIDLRKEGDRWQKYEANTNFGTRHYCIQECKKCKEFGQAEVEVKVIPFTKRDNSMGWKPVNPDGSEHTHISAAGTSDNTKSKMQDYDKVFGDGSGRVPEGKSQTVFGDGKETTTTIEGRVVQKSLLELTLSTMLASLGTINKKVENIESMLTKVLEEKK